MPSATLSDAVCLRVDIPELGLCRGQRGVVCSTWFAPAVAYEVEFQATASEFPTRVLLLEHQVESMNQNHAGR